MSEALGAIHLLCGLVLLALAVMVPVRATNITGGLALSALFLVAAIERFLYGHYRLIDHELRVDSVSAQGLALASIVFVILSVILVIVWRMPSHEYPKRKPPGD
jgi:hypothetical protein